MDDDAVADDAAAAPRAEIGTPSFAARALDEGRPAELFISYCLLFVNTRPRMTVSCLSPPRFPRMIRHQLLSYFSMAGSVTTIFVLPACRVCIKMYYLENESKCGAVSRYVKEDMAKPDEGRTISLSRALHEFSKSMAPSAMFQPACGRAAN